MTANPFDLTGKVALVTGANSGIGLAFAKGLASAGADIVIWGRRQDANEHAAAQIRALGRKAQGFSVDVSDENAVAKGFADSLAAMGRLDTVVVNAGVAGRPGSSLDLTSAQWRQLIEINLEGAFYTIREGAKAMVARAQAGEPGGSIIICGSLSIWRGVPGMAHYAAAKGGLESMTRTFAVELAEHGIRVNLIAPGFIASEMTREDPATFAFLSGKVAERTPLVRMGEPQDLSGACVYLASDASSYQTGTSTIIDGGMMAKLF